MSRVIPLRTKDRRPPQRQPGRARSTGGGPSLATAVALACQGCATPATARSYRAALAAFVAACAAQGVTRCADLTPAVVATFPATLSGAAPATRRQRLAVVRAFVRWAGQADWCDPACATVLPSGRRVRRNGPAPWTVDECRRLLAAADTPRTRALLWVLVSTGARIGEVVAARVADVDGGTLTLRGKTGVRAVPLSPAACRALHAARRSRSSVDRAAPLFASRQGGLSARQARDSVYAACRAAGLPPRGPHALRHAAAARWLRAGIPLVVVAAALGHARPSTTLDHYATVIAGDLVRGLAADPLWSDPVAPPAARPVRAERATPPPRGRAAA